MTQSIDSARPLRLTPFRAVRYNPAVIDDLGAVTCPPYDVIGADRIGSWEAADEHNVVRLILPRSGDGDDRYAHAAGELRRWLATGVLVTDPTPNLYVYEQSSPDGAALGLVGAISLHEPGEQRVLPHEDVFPGPVEDRAALMSATAAQLEPILLTYDGGGPASDVVDEAITCDPDIQVHTSDGSIHRVWRVGDSAALARVAADLADRHVLIADGHHRYAAYLRLRQRSVAGSDAGLAMLVDARRHPLRIGAIHRSVSGLGWQSAVSSAKQAFGAVEMLDYTAASRPNGGSGRPPESAVNVVSEVAETTLSRLADVKSRTGGPAFAIAAGSQLAIVSRPDPGVVTATMPADRSSLWRSLDASVACELVLRHLWGVQDNDPRVTYHHNATDALSATSVSGGVALLLAPPRHDDVLAIAAQGERMPRKSTSFGPKPRTGVLMRLLNPS
ncbi:MAG TPA: DUF1015 domain-containing protein [Jiangellaceae bacterium]